ncbi:tellurite resistance TerB family protein [Hasllibacter sp. MH4015]|uniref:tellurite resistance TerB family protein n=1 Tax=Hasllibacter sp. MH4015 TaxID=2854029 RepID=UPI001CD50244|nr:tellurite resistance TerB family protein [Hasllibacter sp. MH4015]
MSLMRTLAAVAVGVAATKGAQALANRNSSAASGGGGLLDSLREHGGGGGAGGLGALLGGGGSQGRSSGGLGDLLEEFGGSGAMGGLGGMLGGGAAGGLLGGLLGGGSSPSQQPAFGRRLNQALMNGGEPEDPPTRDEEAMAGLMIRAMIMAAKADGRIDGAEREALTRHLGDLDPGERAFVMEELNARIDIDDFARDVPDHPALKAQIFAAAMSAIDIDSARERQFAEDLANALGLEDKARGHVQRRMSGTYGAPPDQPWEKSDNTRAYSQPITAPTSAGGRAHGAKGMQGTPGGQRSPYRK